MPVQKIAATHDRVFNRIFICMNCNAKVRSDSLRVKAGKVKCRKCGHKALRPKKKEVKRA